MALKNRSDLAKPCGCNAKWKGALALARDLEINSIHAATPMGLYYVLGSLGWTYDQALGVWVNRNQLQTVSG